jgi:hypothetical protein
MHQRQHLISLEHFLVSRNKLVEFHHLSHLYSMHDLVVWNKVLLEFLLIKHLSIWDLAHQELHDD